MGVIIDDISRKVKRRCDMQVSKTLKAMFSKARIDIDAMPDDLFEIIDMIDDVSASIDEIQFQIENSSKEDEGWLHKAQAALIWKKREFVALRKYRDHMKRQRSENHRLKQLTDQIEALKKVIERKKTHINKMEKIVKISDTWIKNNYPDDIQAFYEYRDLVENNT